MTGDLSASKIELRTRLRARRRRLAAACPDAALRAAQALPLQRLPSFAAAAGYHPQGAELDPAPLLARLEAAGVQILLPLALDRAAPLEFAARRPGEPLEPDAFGVPAPAVSAPRRRPDLVIVPVLAFDRRGGRLGQGAGAYDRTLGNLRASGAVFVLGLAYAGQEIDRVPSEGHDQRLDAILTETGYSEPEQD